MRDEVQGNQGDQVADQKVDEIEVRVTEVEGQEVIEDLEGNIGIILIEDPTGRVKNLVVNDVHIIGGAVKLS